MNDDDNRLLNKEKDLRQMPDENSGDDEKSPESHDPGTTTTGAEAKELFKEEIEKERKEEHSYRNEEQDDEQKDSIPFTGGDKDRPTTSWDVLG